MSSLTPQQIKKMQTKVDSALRAFPDECESELFYIDEKYKYERFLQLLEQKRQEYEGSEQERQRERERLEQEYELRSQECRHRLQESGRLTQEYVFKSQEYEHILQESERLKQEYNQSLIEIGFAPSFPIQLGNLPGLSKRVSSSKKSLGILIIGLMCFSIISSILIFNIIVDIINKNIIWLDIVVSLFPICFTMLLVIVLIRALRLRRQLRRQEKFKEALLKAEHLVKEPQIKKLICSTLLSITGDVFEYSKILTPLLMGAILAKTIVMPIDSLIFAGIAIVVSKAGVSTICKGYE